VTDPSGAILPGATIEARHLATNVVTTAVSNAEGRFRLPYLRIGEYEITVQLAGFRKVTQRLVATAGAAFEIPVMLPLGGLEAEVRVTAEVTTIEAARSQIASTVSQVEVANLPLNGRNFLEVALLAPGVAPTNIANTQAFPETSAVAGVSVSVNSQRNLSNSFIVDGLSANDDAAGLSGITYSVDAIEQFQVVSSGGQAELGRALGGYINIVTKSGSNALRGSIYDFWRDDRFNAKNPLTHAALPMSQAQFGGSLGGPVRKNRTFYFASAEQKNLDQSGLATITPASVAAVNSKLDAAGYQGPRISTGIFPSPIDSTNLLGKVDHRVNAADQLSVRYSLYDVSSTNARGAGGLSAPTASANLDSIDQAVGLSNVLLLSSQTVLETRMQFVQSDLRAPATDPIGPAVTIAGVASFGTSSGSPTARVNHLFQVVNNVSHQAGSHAFRAGFDWIYNNDRIEYPRSIRGSYSFSSLANFLAGTYNNVGFTQTFGVTQIAQTNPNVGIYAQDEWKANSRVTLNLGVRYDLQFLQTIKTDTDNISPRVGVAYTPFGSRRAVIRGGAGLFFDRVPLRALANALLSAGNTTDPANLRQIAVGLSPTQAGAPVFPNILGGPVPQVTLPNLATMDRNLQNAYSRQANIEAEQQIGERATASVGYEYVRGLKLLMSVNQNVPTCVASGNNNGCRPNPTYANNAQYSSVGDSTYHGMHVSFVQRASGWGQLRVSYTLSKAMNNVGEFFFSSPIDPTDLSKDWGRSDNDRHHRVVLNAMVQTPMSAGKTVWEHITHGFQLSGLLQANSAPPINITSGVTTVQATAGRPIQNGAFIARNAGQGDNSTTLSSRLSRTFHLGGRLTLETAAEGFNLTNHLNVQTRNANFGAGTYPTNPSPTFMQITSVGEARSFQFSARARF
jgi:hypothetical protein